MTNVGIYKITSPTNRVYIGQSTNLKKRFENYRSLDTKRQPKLHNSFLKYGVKNHVFKIIHELPIDVVQSVLDRYEDLYMCQYRYCGVDLLNTKEAGSSGKHSEETKLKISIINKGRGLGMKTRPCNQEIKDKISAAQKGRKKSKEQNEKNRLGHTGLKLSQQTKDKMTVSRSGINNPKIKKVIDTISGVTYISCREAATVNKIRYKNLSRYLNGSRKNLTTLKYL